MTKWQNSDAAVGSLRPGMAEAIEAGGGTVFEVVDWKDDDEVTTTFGSIRQGMLEAADAERERIVALLEKHGRTLVFGDDKRLMANVIRVIRGEFE
jgi:hypothetical protein